MKIILSGGTGFIGKALLKTLRRRGDQVVLLTRNPDAVKHLASESVMTTPWDGQSVGTWAEEMNGADAVINLAGEPVVGKRWNDLQKARIVGSRVEATKTLVSAIGQSRRKPPVLINASAVGYYGHVESGDVTESYPKGKGFLGETCERWEEAARAAERWEVRVVMMRIGIVLEKGGGALSKMIPPFQFFMGGPLGCGRQWVPWVHRDDVIGAVLFEMEHKELSGPVNTASPNPMTMKEFCEALGKTLRRPSWAPVPAFVLRILLGEQADVLLTGQRVIPQKLESFGYPFHYPRLEGALSAILTPSSCSPSH